MKYITEYRDPEMAGLFLKEIQNTVTRPWSIMEVCGGQTHSLVKNGIIDMLPDSITMIHGPGCPVCVTPIHLIDKIVHLALQPDVIVCSFGDMLRVPGSTMSLLQAKSKQADVRILYSPLEAVKIASENPNKQVVFFAVGFETTAPASALSVIHARREGLKNYSILTSHVRVPPAMRSVIDDEQSKVDGFLAAGHVCTIMGYTEYHTIAKEYNIPIVVTGFEPLDILQGILMTIRQLEQKKGQVENQYSRVVREQGNINAQKMIFEVFDIVNQKWRGIGTIPESGYGVKLSLEEFDASKKFDLPVEEAEENPECIAGSIMKGLKKPFDCFHFGKKCTPELPLGAPMVSSEGACAAYYRFSSKVFS